MRVLALAACIAVFHGADVSSKGSVAVAEAFAPPLPYSKLPGAGLGRDVAKHTLDWAIRQRGGATTVAAPTTQALPSTPAASAQAAVALQAASLGAVMDVPRGGGSMPKLDIPLMAYFFFWYAGNYFYNISNKMALKAAGGSTGFPMTIATMQLVVGCIYATFLWLAPDARKAPKITLADVKRMIPVSICIAGAHAASVFALSAGAVSFGQIVKAAEPAFAAVLATTLYGKKVSKAKWMCLIPVIGGVCLASVKELDFAWAALISACVANLFAAFKGNENKKLMDSPGIKDRLGSVGNQFAVTTILAALFSIPLILIKGENFGEFVTLFKTNKAVSTNVLASGLWFYGYNELATLCIKKTNAVTASVANTAKRVIVIVGVAIVLGESLDPMKLLGCGIGIGGVLLYSIIDQLLASRDNSKLKKA